MNGREQGGTARLVSVKLAGSTFTIRTDASREYVAALEQYVNEKLDAVQPAGGRLSMRSALALAALSIADDYFASARSREVLDQNVRERLKTVLARVDAALEAEP